MNSRDLTPVILSYFCETLTDGISTDTIDGISTLPWITRQITGQETYPYINVRSGIISDASLYKSDTTKRYNIEIQIIGNTSPRQVNQIANEIIRLIDVAPADLPTLVNDGVDLTRIVLQQGGAVEEQLPSRTAFIKTIILDVDADFIGLPTSRQPAQSPIYTFTGFEFAPESGLIELYDSGTVTGATTYPTPNNGWDFVSTTYNPQSPISIGETGDTTLAATINYRFATEPTLTTTLSPPPATFRRIRSVRTGTTSATAFTDNNLATTGLRNFANFNVDYGRTRPVQDGLEISGTAGERIYIIYSAVSPQLNAIINIHQLGGNNLSLFTRTVVGGYQIYLQNRPLSYDSTFTFNIT